jgi:hypothetical protein
VTAPALTEFKLKRQEVRLRLAQGWILFLIAASLQPARPGPLVTHVSLHRGVHWLAFAGAAFLLLVLSRNRRQQVRNSIAVVLLGLSLEYLQHLMYRNVMEWWDVRDDFLAVLVVFGLYRLIGAGKHISAPPG